jgi:transposase
LDHAGVYIGNLEKVIHEDDPVRVFAEMLDTLDWSNWEAHYPGNRGQPPIHPRILAGILLFGLARGIRSSRRLAEACEYRLDFRWLAKGLRPDYSTISAFRRRFSEPLKDTFRQINRLAMSIGLIRLGQIAYDGTRVKASNSRYRTMTAQSIQTKLDELDKEFDNMMRQVDQRDAADSEGEGGGVSELPAELAKVKDRQAALRAALEKARDLEEQRRQSGLKSAAQLPITDVDSRVMPNKEGGFAPNYTPTVTTDGTSGFILDCDVLASVNEGGALVSAVDSVVRDYGRPEELLSDAGNNSGANLQAMAEREITVYMPVKSTEPASDSPVRRDDPHQPVPESAWSELPKNTQGKLDKSCFVYVPEEDVYYCPQGKPLTIEQTKRERDLERRVYRCQSCVGCPLRARCVEESQEKGRSVTRDQYEEVRNQTARRMSTPEGKMHYDRRPMIAETPFAILKNVMGVRQFLLRGLENVKTEWRWYAAAFNSMKLARCIRILRADLRKTVFAE